MGGARAGADAGRYTPWRQGPTPSLGSGASSLMTSSKSASLGSRGLIYAMIRLKEMMPQLLPTPLVYERDTCHLACEESPGIYL